MIPPSMALNPMPSGPERPVRFLGAASIGGAPVAYVVMLSTVITVLSFIPFSIALSTGSSFPMAQGVYSLLGWILGPWAGSVASGAGTVVGIFLAPHTAGVPWVSTLGAACSPLYAAAIVPRGRKTLGAILSGVSILATFLYWQHAIVRNGVSPKIVILSCASLILALVLFISPTRRWMGRLIVDPDLKKVALGLFFATWTCSAIMMAIEAVPTYYLLNWPQAVFEILIPVIPVEQTLRSLIGMVIGTGVIAGLRAMTIVKPIAASY